MIARLIDGDSELQQCLQIRRTVFIEEQGVAKNLELDGLESQCAHFLAWKDSEHDLDRAIGTARLWIDSDRIAKAQRVAVLATARGLGIGRNLMRAVEAETRARGISELILGAQIGAQPFYEAIGYLAYGDEFMDAGIPHRMMRRSLD